MRYTPRIGGPIAVIVIGLILALVFPTSIAAVVTFISAAQVGALGWIMVVAGAIWLVLELVLAGRRDRGVARTHQRTVDPATGDSVEHSEIRDV